MAFGFLRVGRKAEAVQRAEIIGETRRHLGDHGLGHGIGRGAARARRLKRFGQPLAVFRVVIPLPARRLPLIHQQAGGLAHLAIEILHPQLALALRPLLERGASADEARIGADLHRHRHGHRQRLERLGEAPLPRLRHHDAGERSIVQRPQNLSGQGAGAIRVAQPGIADRDAPLPQHVGELPHGGKDQRQLLLMVAHIGRLIDHLRHQHGIVRGVEIAERRQRGGELIAEDQPQRAVNCSAIVGHVGHLHKACRRGNYGAGNRLHRLVTRNGNPIQ